MVLRYDYRGFSQAIRRIAHIAGSAHAIVEFGEGEVYQVEPVLDDDWVCLSKPQVHPGQYFNHIIKPRDNYHAVRLPQWPTLAGEFVLQIYIYFPPQVY